MLHLSMFSLFPPYELVAPLRLNISTCFAHGSLLILLILCCPAVTSVLTRPQRVVAKDILPYMLGEITNNGPGIRFYH